MSRRALALGYALALCAIAGSALALRSGEQRRAESPIPSVENADARGAKALFTYLAETGHRPGILRDPFTRLPDDARVVVSLAPTRRLLSGEEWRAIRAWVAQGHTYVYGVPRRVRTQYVETALALEWVFGPRPAPLLDTERLDERLRTGLDPGEGPADPSGADAEPWMPSPLLAGVRSLRVAADDGLTSTVTLAHFVAGSGQAPSILVFPEGRGEIVALAGSDLAENRRLALGDNLAFWANLAARGRIYFDEYHHERPAAPEKGLGAAIGPTVLQLLLAAAVMVFAVGRRFGEPRPPRASRRRSQGEYVRQLARLYAAARVEPELCAELYRSLRRRLFERLGISASLEDPDVARRLEQRTGVPGERYLGLVRRARKLSAGATPQQFAALSREFALLERDLGA